ncbi:hypothetical protein [Lysobacter sp. FW306-1B-D06B]|uniref:hypothetical protein n=1 Tax=Lysobacter sp. FW306-1B-D06B TaxID=3140250 RepID=UPI003140182E
MSSTLTRSRISVVTLAIAVAGLMSGCFVKSTIKSELSAYAEPADGPLARIRLIGSRNVKVYPDSTCAAYTVPGSGYPAGPQMGGQRKRDLGMPKALPMPKHYVEIAARADRPITAGFSFYTGMTIPGVPGTGMPNTSRSANCYVAHSFVPQADQNYEVTSAWNGAGCSIQVMRLEGAGDSVRRIPVPSALASCPASASTRD